MNPGLSRRKFLGTGLATAAGLSLVGCNLDRASAPDESKSPDPDAGWGGSLVDPPLAKPTATLQTLDGQPFDFEEATKDRLTMLFFGYTNCPDQCPVYLNSLAASLSVIGTGPGSKPLVLFVGVDLARDTPEQLRTYLDNIDPAFVGLTGTKEQIDKANSDVYFPMPEIGEPDADGDYLVGHYSQAVAFSPDNLGHRLYGFDVRQEQFVKDLPRLAEGQYK